MKKIPEEIKNIINNFIVGVNKILGNRAKKIILYGSYARGDFNKNSDIDIMILTDLKDEELIKYRMEIYNLAFDIEFENNFVVMISPLIKNIDRFNYWLEAMPFYMNIQKEGVIING